MFFYLLLVLPGWILAKPVTHILHEGKFKVRLTCASEDSICVGFKETIKHVAKFFGNALILNNEVHAAIVFSPSTVKAGTEFELADTSVKHVWSQKAPGTFIPRALCKQIDLCSNDDKVDFTVTINPSQPFYFASDFGKNQNGYSAIDTLAHEFVHGLGFTDCFSSDISNANIIPFFETSPGHYENTARIEFLDNSFVSHIYTKDNKKLTSFIDKLNEEDQIPLGDPTCEKTQLTDYHLEITKKIEALATTSGGLYFKTKTGKKVLLETNGEYEPGRSISHLDKNYDGSQETLMIEDGIPSKGVHDLELYGWLTSPFGPLTLEVLATMGYQLNPKPLYENSLHGLKEKIEKSPSC
ncbi:hypothetical protein DSO57_1005035 [Entomophthora muscae]|uniref:Uncharacterized protein n=1 Tax=Entomophthora muscae TaxID=34485 RepID=A0ACC2UHK3_9FUNG|nr:hypothetical protein DSO57_1005035 [Entomophthora muscae]